ncbi:MAG: DUF1738 domain-containing protein [Bacteroidetes bacterium]|nr:DUF1738 domain-containing protein [Bacteroidota bacterium]
MTQTISKNPINFATGKEYRNDNAQLLLDAMKQNNYSSNEFATMKQWNAQNETVRKGQKGVRITFESRAGETVAFLFNREQLVVYE